MTRARSLRHRLVLGAAAWIVVALVAGALVITELFRSHLERQVYVDLDHHLDQLIAGLEVGPDGTLGLARQLSDPRFRKPYSGLYWQVEGMPEAGVLRSRSLWDDMLGLPPDEIERDQAHHHTLPGPADQSLLVLERTVTLPSAQVVRVAVAADAAQVEGVLTAFGRILAVSFAALGLGLLVAAGVQVVLALRPLNALRRRLAEVRDGRSARLAGDFPGEVQPLVDDLNALMEHDAALVERARVQAGNLAHGLKTPLAILANEADALDRKGAHEQAAVLREQVMRMQRMIDYQLAQARAAAAREIPGIRCPLGECVDGLRRALERLYAGRGLRIEADVPRGLLFRGEREDCEEILGNLLDNACKWARSRVRLAAASEGDEVRVLIDDDGPGIDAAARAAAFERGRRMDEAVPGSGLGLAIVRDMVELYRGRIALADSPLGGLRVDLRLPAARAAEPAVVKPQPARQGGGP